jgi:hypothetical protein
VGSRVGRAASNWVIQPTTLASGPPLHVVVPRLCLELPFVVFASSITCCRWLVCLECMTMVLGLFSG